jgi:glycosyltransferase involved in cell wall biosynthesis
MTGVPPFFKAPGAAPIPQGRLLLISYHFPPGQAAGALRWQKLACHAAERGWTLDVLTLDPRNLSTGDLPRLGTLPPGTRVYGVPRSPMFLERLEHMAWLGYRGLCSRSPRRAAPPASAVAPDGIVRRERSRLRAGLGATRRAYYAWLEYSRDLRWARSVAALGSRLVDVESHLAVISCGPPHMAHWAGRLVAEHAGVPHVMDLRDPWSLVERLADDIASPVWHRLARRYERPAVARAALIVMNTEPARRAMQHAYPEAAHRIITVTNGYDEDEVVSARSAEGRFTIVFAGSVYLDRNPRSLLHALAIVVKDLQLTPNDIRIEFIGDTDQSSIAGVARDEGVEPFIRVTGFRPRNELSALLRKATMLVSLNQDSKMAIPSKIFEYMQYPAWLVALAETGSATDLLLRGTGADVVAPADTPGLADVLRRRYLGHRRGEHPVRLSADPRFSRRTQAGLLFDAIERVVARTRTGSAKPEMAWSLR